MSEKEPKPEKKIPEKVVLSVESVEKGILLIKEFWQEMPHGRDITLPESEDPREWRELTMGDRTMLFQSPPGSGKWKVSFIPNTGNDFSREAIEWLRTKGLI